MWWINKHKNKEKMETSIRIFCPSLLLFLQSPHKRQIHIHSALNQAIVTIYSFTTLPSHTLPFFQIFFCTLLSFLHFTMLYSTYAPCYFYITKNILKLIHITFSFFTWNFHVITSDYIMYWIKTWWKSFIKFFF